ncbi:MAG: hypothetical protein MJ108_09225 [Saccharofermentans sp.]|nr:hypothetical protein [Saccharofermentans sp.]
MRMCELRTDGLYCYIDYSEELIHNSALRFYSDGRLVQATVAQMENDSGFFPKPDWFNIDSAYGKQSNGRYVLDGNNISFRDTSIAGTVDYRGVVNENCLMLSSYSHINGHKETDIKFVFYPFWELDDWKELY